MNDRCTHYENITKGWYCKQCINDMKLDWIEHAMRVVTGNFLKCTITFFIFGLILGGLFKW